MKRKRIVDFDVDRYLRNSKRLDLGRLDWADIPNHPLSDGDVMCLHYMMDIETHTVIYLRDLLATRVRGRTEPPRFFGDKSSRHDPLPNERPALPV
jgi:hypothetical protein